MTTIETHTQYCPCDGCRDQRNAVAFERNHPNGVASPGYRLVDVNPNYFNCGHYPEWVVEAVDDNCEFETREAAEAVAAKKNRRSQERWRAFLDA